MPRSAGVYERHGELIAKIARAPTCKPVDTVAGEHRQILLQRSHLLRGENRIQQPPVAHMFGRIDLERYESVIDPKNEASGPDEKISGWCIASCTWTT